MMRYTVMLSGGFLCAVSRAEDAAAPPLPEALGISTNLIEVTVNLALVLAAIVVLAWLFKRAQGFGQPAAGLLRVTATLPLGPKERILVLQVGDEQIVVGASSAGLTTLHVLDTPLPETPATEEVQGNFRDKLIKSLRKAQA
ncbi:MAG: flagellar biosynthetic protein FliO [Gammaproteobacteria bacterium]|nr:flagellar biosynthetic protein FliO [Gammaproteobacteria bacterium]